MTITIALGHSPSGSTVALGGDLDIATSEPLTAFLVAEAGQSGGDMVVDLRRVGFLDAAGLRTFVVVSRLLASHGRVLTIIGSEPRVLRVFLLTGLDTSLNVHVPVTPEPDPEPLAA